MNKGQEYVALLTEWTDEADVLADGFRSLFPNTTEGTMKFLFTLNFMVLEECTKRGIPESRFFDLLPGILGTWHMAGKPEGEILCVSSDSMKALVEMLKRVASKPSSDA